MPNETLANSQAVIAEVSGHQTLAVFLLGSLGIAICYFGLPYFEGNSFVQFKLTLLRLITDSLPYGGFLMAGWVLVVKTQGQELKTLGLRCCEASFFVLAGILTVLSIAVPSLLYWMQCPPCSIGLWVSGKPPSSTARARARLIGIRPPYWPGYFFWLAQSPR